MLKPRDLDKLPDTLVELYSLVEQDILSDMAVRIAAFDDFIPAAQWQYKKLIEMGNYHGYVVKALASLMGKTEAEVKRIMEQSGVKALRFDDSIYRMAGMNPPPLAASPGLQEVLNSGLRSTMGLFENLTHTTANTSTRQLERVLDRAWLQINSGAFSHQEATRMAIKELAAAGVESVQYPSGHTDKLDVVVRRAVLTGVNQTALKLQEARADEMGCDLVEVTAHAGARVGVGVANHAEWQGRVYSRSGTHPQYPSLVEKTGYGTGPGLGGWNCRHSFFPFIEGISEPAYTAAELEELNAPKYEYNGQKLTEYEATQRQRYIERQIRRWKRENVAMNAAGMETGESASKLHHWQEAQKEFLNQTGLKRQFDRERVDGWGRSQAATATEARKKRLQNPQEVATLRAVSGGRIKNPDGEAASAHAERYYGLIRSMSTDTRAIAKNTGYSEEAVEAIKKYAFIDKHNLGGAELQRFYPDFAMAQSWQRLITGRIEPHDITLLNHELYEKQMVDMGMAQSDAHRIASQKYNYQKESDNYYAALKEHSDER